MDKTTIIVSSVIGSLGVLSAILGFSAEGTKLTPYTILVYGDECIYPPNPALGLGVCAAIFLVVAQVTFSAAGGCCGCCKSLSSIRSETKRNGGIVCAVFSWIAAVIAWALFIEGASWNASVVRETAPFCPYLKDGIFAGAGLLALAATALGVASFIMLRHPQTAAVSTPDKPGEQSSPPAGVVVTGQPVMSPQPQPGKSQQPSEAQVLPAAAQDNGSSSDAPNQELPAKEGRPTDAADAPPPIVVSTDQPVVPSNAPEPKKKRFWKVIGPDIARAGVRVIARVVGNVLF